MRPRPICQLFIMTGLVLIFANAASLAPAQQFPCPVDIPVNVMLPDGTLLRNLAGDAFVVKSKGVTIPFNLKGDDVGPRRILFVVETGWRVKKEAREVEQIVLAQFVARAREQDSFGLLTARGPRHEVPLGSRRDDFKVALTEISKKTKGTRRAKDVLDALREGITWFQQPQPGDAIVLLTMSIGYPPGPAYRQVREALAAAQIRLFGWQLGRYISGYYSPGVGIAGTPGAPILPDAGVARNQENIFALADASGGTVFYENTDGDPWKSYKLTNEIKQGIELLSGQLYKAIVEFYRLQFALPTRDLTIDLADPVRKHLPQIRVIYPKWIPSCSVKPHSK